MSPRIPVMMLMAISAAVSGADFEYNTGGVMGYESELFGSSGGWGQWFVTTVQNPLSQPLHLVEFGFPCCGTTTGAYGWVLWIAGGPTPPPGAPTTADYHGAFTPVEGPSGDPSVYTLIDVTSQWIVIPAGGYFCFGFQNTAYGGQTPYNGVATWSWDESLWIADAQFYRTAVLQVKGNASGALEGSTWARIKGAWGRT